jgi:hypothetical protein
MVSIEMVIRLRIRSASALCFKICYSHDVVWDAGEIPTSSTYGCHTVKMFTAVACQ